MSRTFKTGLRRFVLGSLPHAWGDKLLTAKQALRWRMLGRHWHCQHFADRANQPCLARALSRLRQEAGPRPLAILEFGCNAGNNLRLLRQDATATIVKYCGVDINPRAIAFAQAHFPSDSFHVGDHQWFINHASELGSFDLFIASHVLYYIDEKHARLILAAAHKVADYIVVVDRMQRFLESGGERTGVFTHPFQSICNDTGLDVLEVEATLAPGSPYGFFIARARREHSRHGSPHSP
jgi:SAM-dependent methyltransferase